MLKPRPVPDPHLCLALEPGGPLQLNDSLPALAARAHAPPSCVEPQWECGLGMALLGGSSRGRAALPGGAWPGPAHFLSLPSPHSLLSSYTTAASWAYS